MREPSLPQEAFDRLLKAGIAGMEALAQGARDPAAGPCAATTTRRVG